MNFINKKKKYKRWSDIRKEVRIIIKKEKAELALIDLKIKQFKVNKI